MEELFFKRFQNRENIGSYLYARETAEIIKEILEVKLQDPQQIESILSTIQKLHSAITPYKPTEFSISNVIKRVTSIIREQARIQGISQTGDIEMEESKFIIKLSSFLAVSKAGEGVITIDENQRNSFLQFKTEVMEAIDDIISEFDTIGEQINQYAVKHINNNEIIIVFGFSYTVANLLIETKKKKTFEVIVVENNLTKGGHEMAKKLAEAQIKTTLVPDTAIYAVMHRVHKAILSAHSIMANGGILGTSGSFLIALACKAHLVPMIVVGGTYKLTPKVPFEQDTYNDLINPGLVFESNSTEKIENIDVVVPGFDFISPEYVTLYITNLGEHTPAYIYRVFSENYVKQ